MTSELQGEQFMLRDHVHYASEEAWSEPMPET
jgi:hypothetical protein